MALRTSTVFGVTLEEEAYRYYAKAILDGCPIGVNSSYRDPDLQVWLWHDNYTRIFTESAGYDAKRWGTVWYWRRPKRRSNGAATVSVAIPGTSKHEYGTAIDFPGSMTDVRTSRGWMHRYGRAYGFFWPDWAQRPATREEWHLEFDKDIATIDLTPEEDDMPLSDDDVNRVARAVLGAEMPDRGVSWLVGIKRLYDRVPEDIPRAVWDYPLTETTSARRFVTHTRESVLAIRSLMADLPGASLSDEDVQEITSLVESLVTGLPKKVVDEIKSRL